MFQKMVDIAERGWDRWRWGQTSGPRSVPRTIVEISSKFLSVARSKNRPARVVEFTARDLPKGLVEPSPLRANFTDPEALSQILRSAIEELGEEPGESALLVPDLTVRIGTLSAESLPGKRSELEPYLLWRMRETLPFGAKDAVLSYRVRRGPEGLKVLVAVIQRPVLREYESLLEGLELAPFWVLPTSLALLPIVPEEDRSPTMLVHRDPTSLTCAVPENDALGFYRCRQLGEEASDAPTRAEDIAAEVLPLLSHWESKQGTQIRRIAFSARGGAAEEVLRRLREKLRLSVYPLDFRKRLSEDCTSQARSLFTRLGGPVAGLLANSE